MKTSSAKAKGRRLQQWVRDKIIETFNLSQEDVRSAIMGETGEDIKLSKRGLSVFPFIVECKNQEGFTKVYNSYNQAVSHNKDALGTPLVVIKSNRKEPLAVLSFEDFIRIIKE